MSDWQFFRGISEPSPENLLVPLTPIAERPAWRQFMSSEEFKLKKWEQWSTKRWQMLRSEKYQDSRSLEKGKSFRIRKQETELSEIQTAVNSALALRRPLLVTGNPGAGKTSLAYAIAYELNLGPVLLWPITTRSTLSDALYRYDAIARLQDTQFDKSELELQILLAKTEAENYDRQKIDQIKKGRNVGDYITLGPVGTAFLPSHLPRVLLIDEIDKSDLNLPNDLLNLFEEGRYEIPELVRQKSTQLVEVRTADDTIPAFVSNGRVTCYEFPLVIMTSNGERDFPPAFLRRCLRVNMPDPKSDAVLSRIVEAHFTEEASESNWEKVKQVIDPQISDFARELENKKDLATDQLLNLVYMLRQSHISTTESTAEDKLTELETLKKILLKRLTSEADGR